jgi:hypothetical protein
MPAEKYDVVDWLGIPFVWCCLKTLKHAINEDKPLRKSDLQKLLNAEYTYLSNDRTRKFINQHLLLINPRLKYLIIKYFRTLGLRLFDIREPFTIDFENLPEDNLSE